MAGKPLELKGIHFVNYRQKDKRRKWQVYAWRGGPKIMSAFGERKPALTPVAVEAFREAHEKRDAPAKDTFESLVQLYMTSPEFSGLADSTKREYRKWIKHALDRFKTAPLKLFSDSRMRGEILSWRDQWAHAPRQSHFAMQVLSRILNWGVQRGYLLHNPASNMPSLYRANRADIIWTEEEIEAVTACMKPHVALAFRLAAWTGLARSDLVELRWDQVGELYIERARNKTNITQIIPIFDETRELLKQFPKTAVTVITNRSGKPYSFDGFSTAVDRAKRRADIEGKTLHDLRGTFATKLMSKNFSDTEIDEIMGWETGKSTRIRRRYISRKASVIAMVERFRDADGNKD